MIKPALLVAFIMLALFGCHEKPKFDRDRWNFGDGIEYPYRAEMSETILDSKMLIGLHYPKVIGLLHHPQGKIGNSIYYEVLLTFNKDQMHKKLMFVDFNKDSIVTRIYMKDQDLKMIKQ